MGPTKMGSLFPYSITLIRKIIPQRRMKCNDTFVNLKNNETKYRIYFNISPGFLTPPKGAFIED